jgi:hypothetical protein
MYKTHLLHAGSPRHITITDLQGCGPYGSHEKKGYGYFDKSYSSPREEYLSQAITGGESMRRNELKRQYGDNWLDHDDRY